MVHLLKIEQRKTCEKSVMVRPVAKQENIEWQSGIPLKSSTPKDEENRIVQSGDITRSETCGRAKCGVRAMSVSMTVVWRGVVFGNLPWRSPLTTVVGEICVVGVQRRTELMISKGRETDAVPGSTESAKRNGDKKRISYCVRECLYSGLLNKARPRQSRRCKAWWSSRLR